MTVDATHAVHLSVAMAPVCLPDPYANTASLVAKQKVRAIKHANTSSHHQPMTTAQRTNIAIQVSAFDFVRQMEAGRKLRRCVSINNSASHSLTQLKITSSS